MLLCLVIRDVATSLRNFSEGIRFHYLPSWSLLSLSVEMRFLPFFCSCLSVDREEGHLSWEVGFCPGGRSFCPADVSVQGLYVRGSLSQAASVQVVVFVLAEWSLFWQGVFVRRSMPMGVFINLLECILVVNCFTAWGLLYYINTNT